MKRILVLLTTLMWTMSFGQTVPSDTTSISAHPVELDEVVVLDTWEKSNALRGNANQTSLENQLKQLSGINLISRGSFAQELVYRGQSDGRIQVKLNGMRVYHACTDRMDPSTSYIVSNNLSTAEVSSSTESGANNNGLAGNMNLNTKEPVFQGDHALRAAISEQYSSNTKGWNSAFFVEHNTSKFAWRLNGTWFKNGNYSDGNGNEVLYSQNQKQNWALNAIYRLTEKQFVKLDFIYDLATDVGYPSLPMDVSIARGIIGGITYSSYHPLGAFEHFDVKLYHNDIYHQMDDTHRSDVFMHMDMPGWSRTSGVLFNAYNWKLGKHSVDLAAEYFTNYRRAEMTMYPNSSTEPPMFMLTWPDARTHGAGIGLSDRTVFGKNEWVNTVRFDMESSGIVDAIGKNQWIGMGYAMDANRTYVLPQLKSSFTHSINHKHRLSAAMSFGMRGPTTSELYGFYLFNANDAFDYLGNPDLKAEELYSGELGYRYTCKRITIKSTLFVQRYRNYIFGLTTDYSAMTHGANGVREYHNVDKATFWGFELMGDYQLSTRLTAKAKVDYLRGFRPEFDLPLIPPLQGTLGINYHHRQLSVSAQSRMAAEQTHYNTAYGDRYTPGYALLDLQAAYEMSFGKVKATLSLSINNLLDTYYRDHLNWSGIPSMGRNVVAGVRVAI